VSPPLVEEKITHSLALPRSIPSAAPPSPLYLYAVFSLSPQRSEHERSPTHTSFLIN
jgi:hypothetical protein